MEQEAKVNWTWAELGKCESKGGWWRLQEIENREQQESNRIARVAKGKALLLYREPMVWGGGNLGRQEGPGYWCGSCEMSNRYL